MEWVLMLEILRSITLRSEWQGEHSLPLCYRLDIVIFLLLLKKSKTSPTVILPNQRTQWVVSNGEESPALVLNTNRSVKLCPLSFRPRMERNAEWEWRNPLIKWGKLNYLRQHKNTYLLSFRRSVAIGECQIIYPY